MPPPCLELRRIFSFNVPTRRPRAHNPWLDISFSSLSDFPEIATWIRLSFPSNSARLSCCGSHRIQTTFIRMEEPTLAFRPRRFTGPTMPPDTRHRPGRFQDTRGIDRRRENKTGVDHHRYGKKTGMTHHRQDEKEGVVWQRKRRQRRTRRLGCLGSSYGLK